MLDLKRFSGRYAVRTMHAADADRILALMLDNTRFLQYCGAEPSRETVLRDLSVTPPGVAGEAKYYVGFFRGDELAAVLDLIEGYPEAGCAFIGFFMMNVRLQGRGLGSAIIGELCRYLKETGIRAVQLGIDKGNPQATHFWKKNGFAVIREVEQGEARYLVAEKAL